LSNIIQNIIKSTLGDGARATKYACIITAPSVLKLDAQYFDVLCKTAVIPGKNTDVIDFLYKGRKIPLSGQEKFEGTVELTFYNEENHNLRILIDKWMKASQFDNFSDIVSQEAREIKTRNYYTSTLQVHQLNFDADKETAMYTFQNVFPITVSAITMDSSLRDTLTEFTVTFAYSYYDVTKKDDAIKASLGANTGPAGVEQANNDSTETPIFTHAPDTFTNAYTSAQLGSQDTPGTNSSEFLDF